MLVVLVIAQKANLSNIFVRFLTFSKNHLFNVDRTSIHCSIINWITQIKFMKSVFGFCHFQIIIDSLFLRFLTLFGVNFQSSFIMLVIYCCLLIIDFKNIFHWYYPKISLIERLCYTVYLVFYHFIKRESLSFKSQNAGDK